MKRLLSTIKHFLFGKKLRIETINGFYFVVKGVRKVQYRKETVYSYAPESSTGRLERQETFTEFRGLFGGLRGIVKTADVALISCPG